MKKKIIGYLLSALAKFDEEDTLEGLRSKMDILIRRMIPLSSDRDIKMELKRLLFNIRYEDISKDSFVLLQGLYRQANKRDRTFMSSDLYREMQKNRDPEIKNLRYRVRRAVG